MAKGGGGRPLQVALLLVGYAVVHSLLASRQAKAAATRWLGARHRNGLYRAFFNAHAILLLAPAIWVFLRLPDRTLYRVPPPWSWLMHLGQVAGLGLAVVGARAVGTGRITGLSPFAAWLTGGRPEPEPEAQGPAPGPDGELRISGPFRFVRHPLNLAPVPIVLLLPRMTVNRATLAALSVAYLVIGSWHEEARLRAAYGARYDAYRRGVSFFVPVPGRRSE